MPSPSLSSPTTPVNIAALRGHLSRPPEARVLPTSGVRAVSLDVTVRRPGSDRAESVPVVWYDPPANAADLDAGDEVVVVGHVARRFFRAGGQTQSRTEVVAHRVLPARTPKRAAKALAEAAAEIDDAISRSD